MCLNALLLSGLGAGVLALAAAILAAGAESPIYRGTFLLSSALFSAMALLALIPWLITSSLSCLEINYKLSLANMPPVSVQTSAGVLRYDDYRVRSYAYRVGWVSYGSVGSLHN